MAIELSLAEEHLDEASFLRGQWELAFHAPNYTLAEIASGPEARFLAHIDGLVLGGTLVSEKFLVPGLTADAEGTVFAAAYALAASAADPELSPLLEVISQANPAQAGPVSRALALVPCVGLGDRLRDELGRLPIEAQAFLFASLGALRIDPRIRSRPRG